MSITLLKNISKLTNSGNSICVTLAAIQIIDKRLQLQVAFYSRRSDSKFFNNAFKVVKSKVRIDGKGNYLGVECGPNWELLAPRGNRFYFPDSIGPAWQGASTTIKLEMPLEDLVDFEGNDNEKLLRFWVEACPALIKKSLHELFPTPEVIACEKMALLTLSYNGDIEKGARKFVLAAQEITSRLRLHGYWADFMNPFSGKPFYSWANGKSLYKIDDRFRGLNMKLITKNNCIIISKNSNELIFSGAIYTNAPSNYSTLKSLLDKMV